MRDITKIELHTNMHNAEKDHIITLHSDTDYEFGLTRDDVYLLLDTLGTLVNTEFFQFDTPDLFPSLPEENSILIHSDDESKDVIQEYTINNIHDLHSKVVYDRSLFDYVNEYISKDTIIGDATIRIKSMELLGNLSRKVIDTDNTEHDISYVNINEIFVSCVDGKIFMRITFGSMPEEYVIDVNPIPFLSLLKSDSIGFIKRSFSVHDLKDALDMDIVEYIFNDTKGVRDTDFIIADAIYHKTFGKKRLLTFKIPNKFKEDSSLFYKATVKDKTKISESYKDIDCIDYIVENGYITMAILRFGEFEKRPDIEFELEEDSFTSTYAIDGTYTK